jgi:hypothetical protein
MFWGLFLRLLNTIALRSPPVVTIDISLHWGSRPRSNYFLVLLITTDASEADLISFRQQDKLANIQSQYASCWRKVIMILLTAPHRLHSDTRIVPGIHWRAMQEELLYRLHSDTLIVPGIQWHAMQRGGGGYYTEYSTLKTEPFKRYRINHTELYGIYLGWWIERTNCIKPPCDQQIPSPPSSTHMLSITDKTRWMFWWLFLRLLNTIVLRRQSPSSDNRYITALGQ